MSGATFFPGHETGRTGLVLFLNAGDPSFAEAEELILLFDRLGVDALELAVPFPNVVTDGAVNLRSAKRALARGVDLHATLDFVASIRPKLSRLKLVLLADWRHSVRALALPSFLRAVRQAGCDALLLHGAPPLIRPSYYEQAALVGQPVVTSCYPGSPPSVLEEACAHATAFVYLMAQFGRSGGATRPRFSELTPTIAALRDGGAEQVAVGFGVRTRDDIQAVGEAGADGAVIGSACVACVERAVLGEADLIESVTAFIDSLQGRTASADAVK